MRHALDELPSAISSLHEARGLKGGHRQTAIDLVHKLISEVKAGIEVGEENE